MWRSQDMVIGEESKRNLPIIKVILFTSWLFVQSTVSSTITILNRYLLVLFFLKFSSFCNQSINSHVINKARYTYVDNNIFYFPFPVDENFSHAFFLRFKDLCWCLIGSYFTIGKYEVLTTVLLVTEKDAGSLSKSIFWDFLIS